MKIDKLKELRLSKGLTQRQVAESLNMSESGYCLYEKGLRTPSFDVLVKLSILYGCSIDVFVEEE